MKSVQIFIVSALFCFVSYGNKTQSNLKIDKHTSVLSKNQKVVKPRNAGIEKKVKEYLQNTFTGFEPNMGQIIDLNGNPVKNVLARTIMPNYTIYITTKGVSYVLHKNTDTNKGLVSDKKKKIEFSRFDVNLFNSEIKKENISFLTPRSGYVNYFLANYNHKEQIRSYQKLIIKEVYPGIDWVWEYKKGQMHYEFHVKPHANPNSIKLDVKWADYLIDENSNKLVYKTPLGNLTDGCIYAFDSDGKRVTANYAVEDSKIIFNIKNYSNDKTLIIDPPLALTWGTFYGGGDIDKSYSITYDGQGNVFVCGETQSLNFPTYNPGGGTYFQGVFSNAIDAYILKFDTSGVRQWATYFGGLGDDIAYSVSTKGSFVYVTGETSSSNFPTLDLGGGAYYQSTKSGFTDVFISQFSNTGSLLWSTYYGGSAGFSYGRSVTTDGIGNIYVTGNTSTTSFPTYNPATGNYFQAAKAGGDDAFILKFNSSGQRMLATYYGGNNDDIAYAIQANSSNKVYIVGKTQSTNLPLQNPGGGAFFQSTIASSNNDIFIVELNNLDVITWATYYGGSGGEEAYNIISDNSNNIYLTGWTNSSNFPLYNPGGGAYFDNTLSSVFDIDAVIVKFDNNRSVVWATLLGSGGVDRGNALTLDAANNLYIVGTAFSSAFPLLDPGGGAYFQSSKTSSEGFVTQFDNNGVMQWSTFVGGMSNENVNSVVTDDNNNVYITGDTRSSDFPTNDPGAGAYFQTHGGNNKEDAFVIKFGKVNPLPVTLADFNVICSKNEENFPIIQWKTYSEINNDYFILERSLNGIDFNMIAKIDGAGNSNQVLNYQFVDDEVLNTTRYYRLKQVDFNGKATYFEAIAVTCYSENKTIKIYPNPAASNLFVEYSENEYPIAIINAIGQIVWENNVETNNNLKINISSLSKGIYFLQFRNKNTSELTLYKWIKN